MKSAIISIQMLLLTTLAMANGPDQVISCHFNKVPFHEFCSTIFRETGVRIYYQTKYGVGLSVTLEADSITVLQAVTMAVKGAALDVSVWNNNLVLLPGEKLMEQLPSFEHKSVITDSLDQKDKILTASEERYITGRKADVIETILIGKTGGVNSNGKCKVLARILDEETGEPVAYAAMFISETNTAAASDINGFISIMLKPGKYNALFQFLGYEKKKFLLEVFSDGQFTITMTKAVIRMKEFVVHGDRQLNMKGKDAGLEKILMKTIKDIPMMMGERNILNVSALLPGIVNTGEGAAGLNVRGGSPDQNAFYINHIPVYNTSHLFGFFPAFNSDIIQDFSIYKGHIPAQYGGRLSSVFDINTRQGNLKHFTAHGGISPITGSIVVEGPLKKDTCSFLLSARSSYSDWILNRLQDPTLRASKANFYDFSGGINYDVHKTQTSLFVYHSYDHFRLSDINTFAYSNSGASLTLTHRYTNSLRGEFALIGSQYKFSTTESLEPSSAYEHAYEMDHYEARADFKHVLTDKNTLDYGAGLLIYKLDRGTVKPYGNQSLRNPVALGSEQGVEGALYISDSYDVLPWLNLNAGLRYTLFTPIGPKTVYTYTPGKPRDIRYINDTLDYGNNKVIHWYSEPDIRAAIKIETDVNGSIKMAFNQMHQNLSMLNNTITVAPNAQWKLADYHLLPSKSDQVSLGIFRLLPQLGLETSIEVYYKRTLNYPDFKDGADFLGSALVETAVLQGVQKAYGIEFLLKRTSRKLEGWLSYTYSRSMVKVDGDFPWDRINNGLEYPANYDIPHVLNLVSTYHLSRRVTFSSIIAYQSGKPITYPVSFYYVDGVPALDYSSRNAYRIPHYFRMDISMTLEGNLKRNKFLHGAFILNVYNFTGRQNPYSVYFKTKYGRINGYQYSVIGVPVLTASWIFKLGNYASD